MRPAPHTILVIPTYNNAGTLEDVLARCARTGLPVLVVDDGSTDGTGEILSRRGAAVEVLTHPRNKGKGAALKSAFRKAWQEGYDLAVTIDADGQHAPEDIPSLLEAAGENTLVIGSRDLNADGMPSGNRFANHFSNFWFTVQTLHRIPDTQTGFRVYPLSRLGRLRWMPRRYEAELLLLVTLAWKGVRLAPRPVRVRYPEKRVSSFRPVADFVRITAANVFLCLAALVYGYPRMFIRSFIHGRARR